MQVLLNLLFNAVKFTPQGRIVVTASVQQVRARARVRANPNPNPNPNQVLPAVVPAEKMRQFSRDFFRTTGLLEQDGNTFGPEFEQQYAGHKNYFYYINPNPNHNPSPNPNPNPNQARPSWTWRP